MERGGRRRKDLFDGFDGVVDCYPHAHGLLASFTAVGDFDDAAAESWGCLVGEMDGV